MKRVPRKERDRHLVFIRVAKSRAAVAERDLRAAARAFALARRMAKVTRATLFAVLEDAEKAGVL